MSGRTAPNARLYRATYPDHAPDRKRKVAYARWELAFRLSMMANSGWFDDLPKKYASGVPTGVQNSRVRSHAQEVLKAAHAAGLTDVVIPERTRADVDDVPQHVRDEMTFHPVMALSEVLDLALEPATKSVDVPL